MYKGIVLRNQKDNQNQESNRNNHTNQYRLNKKILVSEILIKWHSIRSLKIIWIINKNLNKKLSKGNKRLERKEEDWNKEIMKKTITIKNKYYLIQEVTINIKMRKICNKLIKLWLLVKERRKEEFICFMLRNFNSHSDFYNLNLFLH